MTSQNSAPPAILSVEPAFALPGGQITLHGSGLIGGLYDPPSVVFGESLANVVFAAPTRLVLQVPDGASGYGEVTVATAHGTVTAAASIATLLSESLHPVANPAVDEKSNIYTTFSGPRGQSVPTSLFRIDDESTLHAIAAEVMNPTGLALDARSNLYISSRHDGTVYRLSEHGGLTTYAEGLGVATGLAFDESGNLYVGDRSGTIFKVAPDRQIFVFATLEPSVAAYHLAFSPNGNLYVTGPTTSSNDCIYEITPDGMVKPWFSNLGRPQGLAFDLQGNVLVAASWRGQRGVIRITPEKKADCIIAAVGLVGLAFDPNNALVLTTNYGTSGAAFFLPWNIPGYINTPELP
ncbi:MAG: IPT/TIG domain-containing protein [Acidobacteriota bacterium]|nr:IPT/TIG domain-containing protein [Acidobacteriota bacterium]